MPTVTVTATPCILPVAPAMAKPLRLSAMFTTSSPAMGLMLRDSVPATSLSMSDTVAVAGLPPVTPSGSGAPKPSVTPSPSSSMLSSTALTVNVFSVSFAANVTLAGMPV